MTIQQSDVKILWARAAGRCSMPECRQILITEAPPHVSGNVLIGENCHIVAEKLDGPRGQSSMSLDDRNRYPNLILLCRNHHAIVDKDSSTWTIERLHQVKGDHEIWIDTQLTTATQEISDQIYSNLVNIATEYLILSRWEPISDHAIRGLVFNSFIDGATNFYVSVHRTNWPGNKPYLEQKIRNLSDRLQRYIQHFQSLAFTPDGNCWQQDRRWKSTWCHDYDARQSKAEEWESACMRNLFDLCLALNDFADAVRQNLNPSYFALQGRFLIYDSMGVMNELQETWYDPQAYYLP